MKPLISFTLLFSLAVMGQKFHTDFKYNDSLNNGIRIQNSYPKGGQKYTDPYSEKEYVYVIFWTRISNETASNLKLEIHFPHDSFTIPSSLNTIFNLFLPKEKMAIEKDVLFNYGLDINSVLNENINKPSELTTIIPPKNSYLFYTVAISNKGVNGVVRTGFELEKRDLIYKINGYKIICGRIVTKN
ncbi:hypothetical protein [Tenacibaculum caenipelagi]|uniref:Uncharacterized protein n=1 Tax=Tenacibaculum caenipelagi TaxID=1325435 RepID=A0A4R6TDM3_9FLAO|nr:hypothetical protein [Tenacibaculum caenipelagi]TDQ27837.1 hypothetical protein DFQ07_1693 [Tenacibaculum caenipelagi]